MKDQERRNIIKKYLIVILLSMILSINFVYAKDYPEITNDIEIRYKWYKEVISNGGEYVPKDEITKNDVVNEQDYYYAGRYSNPNSKYCNLSPENYQITRQIYTTYKKVPNVSYVLIENIIYNDNIKIYYNNKPIDFNIIAIEQNKVKIDLKGKYLSELLLFFVDTETVYTISLYINNFFLSHTLSKEINSEKISIPDKTWITEKTLYETIRTTSVYENSDLTTILYKEEECMYRDILVYRYNTERQYYDDNYHVNIEGYTKDLNDYKFYYKGEPIKEEPIINTIEVIKEKIIKEPQIEYVYIEKENTVQENFKENDSSNQETECLPETITEIKKQIQKEIVEKEVPKIPKIIYIIISILVITISILTIKLYKKYVV